MIYKQTDVRQSAEDQVFALRKKIDTFAAVGDSHEVSVLQLEISRIQKKYGVVTGTRRKSDEHTV